MRLEAHLKERLLSISVYTAWVPFECFMLVFKPGVSVQSLIYECLNETGHSVIGNSADCGGKYSQ